MAKQVSKIFVRELTNITDLPLDYKINAYLEEHQNYKVSTASYSGNAGIYEKALVIFDIWEPKNAESKKQGVYSKWPE